MINPIEAAVLPRKTEAIDHAEERARDYVNRIRVRLEGVAWNLNEIRPYPNYRRGDYNDAKRVRSNFLAVCSTVDPDYERNAWSDNSIDCIVEMNEKKIEHFVKMAREGAADAFVAYVAKLVMKCGPVKSATLSGGFIWDGSILTVETEAEVVENWSTKMIVNYSVYGKAFNQFPTRKIKPKKGGRA